MKLNFLALIFSVSSVLLSGCAHKHTFSEDQVKKDFPEGAVAELGSAIVSPGDRVDLIRETCRREAPIRGSSLKCTTKKVGGALVVSLIDAGHAVIKIDEGITYEKGIKIKKSQ